MSGLTGDVIARWRQNPASFMRCLINPDTGKPFELFEAEITFLKYAFKTGPDGRLLYQDWIYSGPKKTGKTAFGALLELTVVLLFGGRNSEGYCLANDQEQAQSRVFEAIKRIIEATSFLKAEARITADRIVFPALDNATIITVASDAASAAGGAPTISCFDEIWGFRSERAYRLWDEMISTPTRRISCRLVVTYAGFEGESLLLKELYDRGKAQPEVAPDLYAGNGILLYWTHRPQAPWQTEAWLADMRRSLRPTQFQRMIENRWAQSESPFIDMALFDLCVDPEMRPVVTDRSMPVYAAVDASIRRDSTALVAVMWSARQQRVRLLNHRIIQPTADQPIDFEAEVEQVILDWNKRYFLKCVMYDPYQMIASAQRLRREGVNMQEYSQTMPNLTLSSQNLFDLIKGRNITLYPNSDIRLAVSRATAVEGSRGWRIGKEKQTHKIDVVVSLAMAALAAVKQDSAPMA
jgi:phage terminase large subunit-like protein